MLLRLLLTLHGSTMEITEFLYIIVMELVRLYKRLSFFGLKLIEKPLKTYIIRLNKEAGITYNGSEPHDIRVNNKHFYLRLAHEKLLGLGESYMDGWWDCDRLDEYFSKVFDGGLWKAMLYLPDKIIHYIQFDLFNLQTSQRSWEVAEKHYNLGNPLFESFLDPSMNYSCGYWKDAKDLTEAQQHKMDLIGRKLKLKPGMRVLDIGCGYGGLCKYLAAEHQVQVVGITVSKEGAKMAQERCAGLPVEIRVQDYRDLNEKFDRIVSVGMFEHVGRKNYRLFFEIAERCLPNHGIFLLHTIGIDNDEAPCTEPWTNKYIFPNGILPDHKNIPEGADNLFTIEDWHNFGADYDKTLMAWHSNFLKNWPKIEHLFENSQRFYRMWTYYLLGAAALFRTRKYHLWQIVLSKKGIPGGYK